jgi:putative ABC transport system ATP-binding protein
MLIQVKNLCKTYENEGVKTAAMCGASFSIGKGEFVSIMGPSGSGKSTLMQILGMLDRPTEGKYFFEGKDTFGFDDDTLAGIRNKKIGFVFQSFNLLPRTSVYENVELPLLYDFTPHQFFAERDKKNDIGDKNGIKDRKKFLRNWWGAKPDKNNEKKVMDALKAVGMEHREKYLSNQLSGGEKQRVAIARALVNDPDVVFADEPTGNLDSKSGLQVMRILQKLNGEGHTVILVTHETYTAEHAERILYMKDGQIIADDPVKNRRVADGESELLK